MEIGVKNHIKAFRCDEDVIFIELDKEDIATIKNARAAPRSVTINGESLREMGKTGCAMGLKIVQFIKLPPTIAPKDKNTIGYVEKKSSSEVYCREAPRLDPHNTLIINRIE